MLCNYNATWYHDDFGENKNPNSPLGEMAMVEVI